MQTTASSQKPEEFTNPQLGKLIYYAGGNWRTCLIIRPKIASQEVYRLTEDLNVDR